MWYFTDVADWFENKRSQTDSILDQWVEDSGYSTGTIIVASTTKAFTTFGAGFVDLLRLGDGISEGSLKGAGQDALRFVAIFPFGKAASMLRSAKGVTLAKVVVDTGGPNCFWVASAKALAQISHKHNGQLMASVDDIAKSLGMSMNNLLTIPSLAAGLTHLRRLGAQVGPIKPVSKIDDLSRMLPHDGSVAMMVVDVMKYNQRVGRHAIYAFRNSIGQIRFMDRTVGNGVKSVFRSLDDIAAEYPQASHFLAVEAALIKNVFVKTFAHDSPRLVIPLLGVIATEERRH